MLWIGRIERRITATRKLDYVNFGDGAVWFTAITQRHDDRTTAEPGTESLALSSLDMVGPHTPRPLLRGFGVADGKDRWRLTSACSSASMPEELQPRTAAMAVFVPFSGGLNRRACRCAFRLAFVMGKDLCG